MPRPATTSEKVWGAGIFALLFAALPLIFFNIHGRMHTLLVGVVLLGFVVFKVGFLTDLWSRNRWNRSTNASPEGAFWLWIVGIVLFLGVLPLACLWAYHAIHHPAL